MKHIRLLALAAAAAFACAHASAIEPIAVGELGALVPSKLEGLTFGDDVSFEGMSHRTLWLFNDNDFVPAVAGPNRSYVLAVTDEELGTVLPAQALPSVPEARTYALFAAGLGMIGWHLRRLSR